MNNLYLQYNQIKETIKPSGKFSLLASIKVIYTGTVQKVIDIMSFVPNYSTREVLLILNSIQTIDNL